MCFHSPELKISILEENFSSVGHCQMGRACEGIVMAKYDAAGRFQSPSRWTVKRQTSVLTAAPLCTGGGDIHLGTLGWGSKSDDVSDKITGRQQTQPLQQQRSTESCTFLSSATTQPFCNVGNKHLCFTSRMSSRHDDICPSILPSITCLAGIRQGIPSYSFLQHHFQAPPGQSPSFPRPGGIYNPSGSSGSAVDSFPSWMCTDGLKKWDVEEACPLMPYKTRPSFHETVVSNRKSPVNYSFVPHKTDKRMPNLIFPSTSSVKT